MRVRARHLSPAAALFVALTAACDDYGGSLRDPAPAYVRYVVDAPFCSFSMPVEFRIDSQLVATDTFRVHLTPDHTQSQLFSTSPGRHKVSARSVAGYLWRDTSVVIAAGTTFTDTLPFYCS